MRDILRELGSVVGLFVALGVGFGLAGYLAVSQLTLGSGVGGGALSEIVDGFVAFQALTVVYVAGPVVGAIGGVLAGRRSEDSTTGAVAGAVGSFVGVYLMVAVAYALVTFPASADGIGVSPGRNVTLIAASGVPSALVGAVAGAIAGLRASSPAAASRTAW